MNEVTVIIPVVRPDRVQECKAALVGQPCAVISEMDTEGIGCPKMVKRLVAQVKTPYVLFLGDDTVPEKNMVIEALAVAHATWTDGVGLVGINDGAHGDRLATHWMAHMDLLPKLDGEFFCTEYQHAFCDNELTARCKEMKLFAYAPWAALTHNHPAVNSTPSDAHYARVYKQEVFDMDRATFVRRQKARIGWGTVGIGVRLSFPAPQFIYPWTALTKTGMRPGDRILAMPIRFPHANAANYLAGVFMDKTECDTLLLIDDDMTFSADALSCLRDSGTEYDIISGLPVCRLPPHRPIVLVGYDHEKDRMVNADTACIKGIMDVNVTGLAFTLIRRWVIQAVAQKVYRGPFESTQNKGEDAQFCTKAIECGAKVGVNTDVSLGHVVHMVAKWDNVKKEVVYSEQ